MLVAYLTHPLSAPDEERFPLEARQDNIANSIAWFRFLVNATRWAICLPWLAYVMGADEDCFRPRALTDQICILKRCDLLVLTGGKLSPHMEVERNHARNAVRPMPVLDLLDLGKRPPADHSPLMRVITQRVRMLGLVE